MKVSMELDRFFGLVIYLLNVFCYRSGDEFISVRCFVELFYGVFGCLLFFIVYYLNYVEIFFVLWLYVFFG